MTSIYHLRNRNHCVTFVIFQIIFVALQVFVFYPCWQHAPSSTIFRRNQQVQTQPLPTEKPKSRLEQSGETVKNWINQGVNYIKKPPILETKTQPPPTTQQTDVEQKSSYKIGQVFDAIKNKVGLGYNQAEQASNEQKQKQQQQQQQQQVSDPQKQLKEQLQRQQEQQEQLKQQQNEKEGEQLRNQKAKMQETEVQKAVQQNQLASKIMYNATWESLESRPNPLWYDSGKIGIFIHWGVYSVPSYSVSNGLAEWFWFYWKSDEFPRPVDEYNAQRLEGFIAKHADAISGVKDFAKKMYGPKWRYTDFAPYFKAEMFDPQHWANVFRNSGAKYVVLTSKHHDGFTLWPSKKSWNWNSVDVGPHQDLVGELGKAVRAAGLRYGLYHSLYEWFNPKYNEDKKTGFKTQTFVKEKLMPELMDLVNTYRPDIVWSDGQFEAPCSYWNCTQFLAWLYNESPVRDTVVTNDRWGTDILCKHGGYLTCADRYNPDGKVHRKWENCMTIDRESWGYRRNAVLSDYFTIEALLELLAKTVSNGGNLLMNIGPTADGRIPPIFEERLLQMGKWLAVNGEAIYETTTWATTKDPKSQHVYYTQRSSAEGPTVYFILTSWPEDDQLELAAPIPSMQTKITWLGYHGESILWKKGSSGGLLLTLPKVSISQIPCRWAWAFKISHLLNAVG